ncbi:IS605 OrfB family transposase [Methanomicrobium sp. W14]|uniref:RNA-guided endonuclease TnpB family protein n=1 Tax=Methanomicrobium sp. W14 TaxID=2817839 RepID=UPI001AE0FEF4|nr:RNA-guided endonuclease TnpB family protein [Methanomicrobium sp. W14]MBP2132189.1 IS605 OrfB family transposase [Methanomicrobium sp. W14]
MTTETVPAPGKWIGIDLNTTGSIAVVAEPGTGFTAGLGKEARIIHDNFSRKRKENKSKKSKNSTKRIDRCEKEQLMDLNRYLSHEIIKIALNLNCGIKFEMISKKSRKKGMNPEKIYDFSINGWYFKNLCQMVENRAVRCGITVIYVDPSFTSQICSRCGRFGHRHRKVFSCPHCGYQENADINAALNIARSPVPESVKAVRNKEREEKRKIKVELKRLQKEKWNEIHEDPLLSKDNVMLFFEKTACEI